ncbi:hypothetical protein NDU88_001146 [Pleurodeles waltl]|uniref:Uncharacterized protein n=1 Tax=Pleurodeles waltl TaxID=8319 RepID=A0AAV7VZC7_PLEWA|nr:hypothetical protein NDU88_001146 [Pleurodeles waltl]
MDTLLCELINIKAFMGSIGSISTAVTKMEGRSANHMRKLYHLIWYVRQDDDEKVLVFVNAKKGIQLGGVAIHLPDDGGLGLGEGYITQVQSLCGDL